MAMSKRAFKTGGREVGDGRSDNDDDNYDGKTGKAEEFEKFKKMIMMGLLFVATLVLYVVYGRMTQSLPSDGMTQSKLKIGISNTAHYELYPFLVDSDQVVGSVSKKSGIPDPKILSNPTLPAFPVIDDLEDCKIEYKSTEPVREDQSEWRPRFWVPSFPGSGSSNPTNKGDILKNLISSLARGDVGEGEGLKNPVKNYHASIKNRLKRCKGISETIACSSGHPTVSTSPETQTGEYHPETIVPIRNPATVIPISYAYKNIQYHGGEKQAAEESWNNMRDDYFQGSFDSWIDLLKFWRGSKEDSYYFTKLYVPFEDLVTTDATKGATMVKKLSDTISGRDSANAKDGFFATATSEEDYKCIWYRVAKEEWEREKLIIGDYIPSYTKDQKEMMVSNLRAFAVDIESDSFDGDQDAVLVSLLRRYAEQIEKYVRVV